FNPLHRAQEGAQRRWSKSRARYLHCYMVPKIFRVHSAACSRREGGEARTLLDSAQPETALPHRPAPSTAHPHIPSCRARELPARRRTDGAQTLTICQNGGRVPTLRSPGKKQMVDANSSMKRRLAAILAADIAGYSRLMGED